ncbi:rubredoxin [Methanoregula sp. UBA64]|jgi:rubredoxin|uniref:rubredoxin n=1 Tax=Methanoregula sp. UBA64 TaxID=1915554 RepID=UPI0025FB61EF|nr:rubredoxin [Methanoregula sp. UBA64]
MAGSASATAKAKAKKPRVRPVTIPEKPRVPPAKKPVTTAKSAIGRKKTTVAAPKSSDPKKRAGAKKAAKKVPVYKLMRYRCRLCGYIYSPLRGEPQHGIPAGTPFEDLPEDYVCPVCGYQGKGKIGKWGFDEWVPTQYICSVCGYVYNENRGEPHRGIKPGTRFEDLPEDYSCPVCAQDPKISVRFGKVLKQGFEPLYIP